MGLFDLFSRKKKAVSKNWLENGYLIVEKLLEATKRKDISSLKEIAKSDECVYFCQQAAEAAQVVVDKVDSGEKRYQRIWAIFEKLDLTVFDLWGTSEEAVGPGIVPDFRGPGTLGILKHEGKRFKNWEELNAELELVKKRLLELMAEEKRLKIKLSEI